MTRVSMTIALSLALFGLAGCSNAATEACEGASPANVAPGSPPGGPSECQVCCQRNGSYQAANNNVEMTCECN